MGEIFQLEAANLLEDLEEELGRDLRMPIKLPNYALKVALFDH